jgi:hypothetical protein
LEFEDDFLEGGVWHFGFVILDFGLVVE